MNILNQIIADKKKEVALKKSVVSALQLEGYELFNSRTISLSKSITNSAYGIIAEHKRRSPSKSEINYALSVEDVVVGYEIAGASGISILTDGKYFGGSLEDLLLAKACAGIPILRKEFVVDEYQILEAKAHGADAILLIAAVLSKAQIRQLSAFAQSLALEVLLEIHNLEELEKSICPTLDMIGVNNRNLKNFDVHLEASIALSNEIPNEFVKISESGIDSSESIKLLQKSGYQGFLIGEHFMKTQNPGESLQQFLSALSL